MDDQTPINALTGSLKLLAESIRDRLGKDPFVSATWAGDLLEESINVGLPGWGHEQILRRCRIDEALEAVRTLASSPPPQGRAWVYHDLLDTWRRARVRKEPERAPPSRQIESGNQRRIGEIIAQTAERIGVDLRKVRGQTTKLDRMAGLWRPGELSTKQEAAYRAEVKRLRGER